MEKKNCLGLTFLLLAGIIFQQGCMSFDQKSYDLQEKYIQREQAIRDAQKQDTAGWRW